MRSGNISILMASSYTYLSKMVMVDRTHDMAPKHSTVKTIPLFVAYK